MKVFVKTLKGTHFEIEVKSEDMVTDVKRSIEATQGSDVYPATQQMLIYQGKVLKDNTTLAENKVSENSFIVIMLTKSKVSSSGASTAEKARTSQAPAADSSPPLARPSIPSETPAADQVQPSAGTNSSLAPASSEFDVYGQAASNLVAGNNLEATIQQLLDMGGGSWDRNTVVRALRAAYNNPERAVDYLYSGIPVQSEAPIAAQVPASVQTPDLPTQASQPVVPTSSPNSNPLDLFPQGLPDMGSNEGASTLDFLRNSQQFQAFRAMVQANPQILQPMLQELGKQNPNLMRLIEEHQADFHQLIDEPVEDGNMLGQLASAMPQALTVTVEERNAIERLEAMGFDRAIVLEVFFACNKNEELAANYLLDHIHDFED